MANGISKSKYCSGIQCPKMLWLKKHVPEAFDDSCMNEAVLETGLAVGDLAMGLFGDFVEVPYSDDLGKMIDTTARFVSENTPVIAEASFSIDGLFCSVDILKMIDSTTVEIYEVKSSTSVHDIYYHDAAFQYYVLTKLGYKVASCSIVHINNRYVRQGDLNIHELFTIADVTQQAQALQPEIPGNIQTMQRYMSQATEPTDDIGEHCFAPYNCGFFGYCTKHLPSPNVFDIAGARKSTMFKCYRQGIVSFAQLNTCDLLSKTYYTQIEHELYPCPPKVDAPQIKDFLKGLSYPLYFLDFESFQPALPPYDNTSPFQKIPFQYSLHYIEEEGGALQHREFLAYPGKDPRRALAQQLCADIPMDVCTTAYNMGFEKGVIKALAAQFPDLADHLMNIHDHIVDLMVPFQKKWYYCRAMEGSYSIKYVLPALFPNDPELDYHNLEGVHNGTEASETFEKMATMTPEEIETKRQQLLKYCGLDTYAMVKVWEKLKEAVK